jgi:WD40 repeat protein
MSFSPDSRILAISHSPQTLKLLDPVAGEELATLPGEVANPLCFSPDGAQLVISEDRTNVRVWDLRLVRQRLAALNLDWNLPPYPPAPEGPQSKPLRVERMAK